jgi:hypothetical protein
MVEFCQSLAPTVRDGHVETARLSRRFFLPLRIVSPLLTARVQTQTAIGRFTWWAFPAGVAGIRWHLRTFPRAVVFDRPRFEHWGLARQ